MHSSTHTQTLDAQLAEKRWKERMERKQDLGKALGRQAMPKYKCKAAANMKAVEIKLM